MTLSIPEELRDLFQRDEVARYLGVELQVLEAGHAVIHMQIRDRHRNLFGAVHGGVIFMLADIAFGLAGNAGGTPSVAIDASIQYMKSVRSGILSAEARQYGTRNQMASYHVVVRNEGREPVASFYGTAYQKPDSHSGNK